MTNRKPLPICPLCTQTHFLNQCKEFRTLSYQGRLKFVNKQKLCRACLKTGHIAKKCHRTNETCKKQECKEPHPTLLHSPEEDKQEPPAANAPVQNEDARAFTDSGRQVVKKGLIDLPKQNCSLLPILSVKIRVNGSPKTVVAQELLDTERTHSFMTEDPKRN